MNTIITSIEAVPNPLSRCPSWNNISKCTVNVLEGSFKFVASPKFVPIVKSNTAVSPKALPIARTIPVSIPGIAVEP